MIRFIKLHFCTIVIRLCLISAIFLAAHGLDIISKEGVSSWISTLCAIIVIFWPSRDANYSRSEQNCLQVEMVYDNTSNAVKEVCHRLDNALAETGINRQQKYLATRAIRVLDDLSEVPMKLQSRIIQIRNELDIINNKIDSHFSKNENNLKSPTRVLIVTLEKWIELDKEVKKFGVHSKPFPASECLNLMNCPKIKEMAYCFEDASTRC